MKYISVFSGIEAASVAWNELGFEPVAFSELDDFPSAVLAQRFPNVPNLGDITKIDWSDYAGAIDIVVGGSPCQSFSIAGNRTGLEGASGLMWEYVRCVREVRPRWFVWENVPGALSSTKGEDFRCLLESMDELGYGMAWRVLDAQFFGVAQRRRRLFLVGSLGDRRSADVLFEPESLRRDPETSRKKRKELTGRIGVRSEKCLPFDTTQVTSPQNGSNPKWGDPCHPLCATGHTPTVCLGDASSNASVDLEISGTLKANNDRNPPIVSYRGQTVMALDCRNHSVNGDLSGTIQAKSNGGQSLNYINPVMCGSIVRRLTPRECERLQGFPDDWTFVEWKGKKAPDGKRYKALGNSMAVPVMKWIGQRILSAEGGECL